jgi:hypothetical protein
MSIIYELNRKSNGKIAYHGKTPIIHTKSEDLLTANVFGVLKNLNWRYALKPFLENNTNNSISETEFEDVKFYFWNRVPTERTGEGSSEVDLIIELKTMLFFVEAKYGADVSERTTNDPGRDQLIRNLDLGRDYRNTLGLDSFHLIFITPHANEPEVAIQYRTEPDFTWTNWGAVAKLLFANIDNYTKSERRLAGELIDYLTYKEFYDFPYSKPESRMKINEKTKYNSTLSRLTKDEKISLKKIMNFHNLDLLRSTHYFDWLIGFSFKTLNPEKTVFSIYTNRKQRFKPKHDDILDLKSLDEYLGFVQKER